MQSDHGQSLTAIMADYEALKPEPSWSDWMATAKARQYAMTLPEPPASTAPQTFLDWVRVNSERVMARGATRTREYRFDLTRVTTESVAT